jgi:hypothetical protein
MKFRGPKALRDRFEGPSGSLVSFDNSDGPCGQPSAREGRLPSTGTRIDELHVTDTALAAYAGAYRSTELEATYRLTVEMEA